MKGISAQRTLLILAFKSLFHRKVTVLLTISSLILSVFLLLSIDQIRRAAKDGFTQTISQTDLIVGARTGPTNLVLSTVFNRGTFANNISRETYLEWKSKPSIEWTIPLVLGDGHKGYRVVGTTEEFYQHYRYQGHYALQLEIGEWNRGVSDIVLGSEVAKKLGYSLGHAVVLEHGVTREVGMLHHDEAPFKVVGILQPTGTIVDQSLFVSLESLDRIHHEEAKHGSNEDHEHGGKESLTAFFMKLKNRIDILTIQREINNYQKEALSAVIPAVVVNDIWHMLSYVENALKVLGACVLLVSLFSMLTMLLSSLNERRREMAILRSLGASPVQLSSLLIFESTLMTVVSLLGGFLLQGILIFLLRGWLKENYGIFIESFQFQSENLIILIFILTLGLLVGIIPAIRVYKTSLKDGLIVR